MSAVAGILPRGYRIERRDESGSRITPTVYFDLIATVSEDRLMSTTARIEPDEARARAAVLLEAAEEVERRNAAG